MSQLVNLYGLKISRIYIPHNIIIENIADGIEEIINRYKVEDAELVCLAPKIMNDNELKNFIETISSLNKLGIEIIMAGNIGIVGAIQRMGYNRVLGDLGLNVFNSIAANSYYEQAIEVITLSPELKLGQIKEIIRNVDKPVELVVYGRLSLMITEYCPIDNYKKYHKTNPTCSCKTEKYSLVDRKGMVFPILTDNKGCRIEILNSQTLFLADKISDIISSGAEYLRLIFTNESPERCKEIVKIYTESTTEGYAKISEKYARTLKEINEEGYTRGHYYRGVE